MMQDPMGHVKSFVLDPEEQWENVQCFKQSDMMRFVV